MNFLIIFVVALLAAFLVVALYRAALGAGRAGDISDPRSLLQPLDVAAFNNLMSPTEELFLRENLSSSAFRSVQRLRLRAAIDYVQCAGANAASLISIGRSATSEIDTQISYQARDMVTAAMHLRLLSMLVLCLLCVKIAFPRLRLSLSGISASHKRLLLQLGVVSRIKDIRQVGAGG